MRLTKANIAKYVLPAGKAEALLFDDDLPGFGLRVRAGGKRVFCVQFRIGSKQRRVTLGTTETLDADQARKRAREALAKVSLGADPQTEKRAAKEHASVTLAAVVPRYLAYAERRQKAGHHQGTRTYLQRHWAPLAEISLEKVSRATVSERLAVIANENGPYAANRARAALSAFFTWAIGEGVATANPVVGTHKPADEKARDRVLNDAELADIWHHAGDGDFGAIVRLLVLTGQRREEVGGLLWSELTSDLWTIGASRTKNGKPHALMLPPQALAILDGRPRQDGRDLAFGSGVGSFQGWSNGKQSLDARIAVARKARRAVPVEMPPWRLHDVRRTVATGMARLGVVLPVIEKLLNHTSGSFGGIVGVYQHHTFRDEKRAALELWAEHVQSIVARTR
ncbi:tyrosine-type recombinase/integrase [Lichenifustis flavocetrariae]|uniref:Integrase arm-type DNA-binding domain-containing protein n=1 Tax=Lichenifustis flavocetrariae TaxID=2949735 RepID=A0AA41YYZ6_9HYPH|nr:integrase arm-type DNA-binding domain-containing protein [Lichenifustis flavocetrariae]MCW6509688.1 integrase arm-type DNA-binding domain-containing protein [Lichenifustis flavocetrariae]